MRATARKITFLSTILCAVLLLSQCGLPRPYKQLIAPDPIYNTGVTYFQFKKITVGSGANQVEDEFRGFELYYRFFEDTPGNEVYADTFEQLLSRGYRRVYSWDADTGSSGQAPLILVNDADRTKQFTITVDFSSIKIPDYGSQQDAPTITASEVLNPPLDAPITDFRRALSANYPNDDRYKKFTDFDSDDVDIKDIWTSFQSSGKLLMYVLSYGYDVAEFGDLYSEPVLLGSISRDFDL